MSEEETVSEQLAVNNEENTPSSLRDTPPCQGESLNNMGGKPVTQRENTGGSPMPQEKTRGESLDVPKLEASATLKTQGVRAGRGDAGRRVLDRAAKAAAKTGRRGDVHEYMRLRRNYV
ncbi:MAG: hypothetical protein LLF76_02465 [Planctomycetaceae bacterium]|nr:hypothetical protein [Planctomycetaceae bacterium]